LHFQRTGAEQLNPASLNDARGIVIGVRGEAAALTDKPPFLTVVRVNVPTAGTFLTRIGKVYARHELVAPRCLVGQLFMDDAPAGRQNRFVQPGLRAAAPASLNLRSRSSTAIVGPKRSKLNWLREQYRA